MDGFNWEAGSSGSRNRMPGWLQDTKPINRTLVQGGYGLCKACSKPLSSTRHRLWGANRPHTWHPRIGFGTRRHVLTSKPPARQPPSSPRSEPSIQPPPIRKVTKEKCINKPWQGNLESLAGPRLGLGLEVVSGK